ncbi:sensor histidine kinase [Amycolatopsis alba]|uniref:histidine kinase n=1 Tax=Amycolatopsis alba DSM 44262 TaxID=1125972 RepID=A0A229S1C3_AMYAL|nr:histidine kinase [Amycolatopsis alba]OXM52676.1 two-component sensor histidine kinase [Amycolatopsis alba DSM 44262]
MTEVAAEPGDHRARSASTAVWPVRLGRAAGRWASQLPPVVRGSLLPALLLLNVVTTRPPRELPAAVIFTVVLMLPLVWRHRAPRTVFAAVAAAASVQWLLDVQLSADIALLVAFYTVAVHSELRGTLVAGAVLEAGGVLACLRWATDGAFLTPFVAVTAMIVAVGVFGVHVRANRAYLAAVEERAVRLEREQDQQARVAVAEERTRITREMHDIVTHNLSVMVALTDAAVYAQHRSPGKATTAMLQVSETGRQALTDMRRSLGVLRAGEPDALRHPLPGIAQLTTLGDQMSAAGLPTRVEVHGGHTHVPATAQLTVYRLVQEALTNSLKHTPAGTHAKVRIECSHEAVTVDVTDSGPRPPSPDFARSGHGVAGMRERSAAYGGTLRAGPLPGGGWSVHTRLFLAGSGVASA